MNKIKIIKGRNTVTTDIAYIAGFFDGEGCIRIKKANQGGNSYYITANITNTNRKNLEFVQNIFGGQIREQEKTKNKTVYQYYLSASEAVDMLRVLLSFLIEKSEQAKLAIKFHERKEQLSPEEKAEYYKEMRELKVIGNIYSNPRLTGGIRMIDLSGKCFFCEQPVGEEGYCYGCGFSICNSCDLGEPVGQHNVRDHSIIKIINSLPNTNWTPTVDGKQTVTSWRS